VTCVGPATALTALSKAPAAGLLEVRWTATATLDADRDSAPKSFGGNQAETLIHR